MLWHFLMFASEILLVFNPSQLAFPNFSSILFSHFESFKFYIYQISVLFKYIIQELAI